MVKGLNKAYNEYSLNDVGCVVQVYWREWLPTSEYSKLVQPVHRTKIVDEVFKEEANLKLASQSKLDKIIRLLKIDKIQNYLNEFPLFESITKLEEYKISSKFLNMELIELIQGIESDNENLKISVYKNTNTNKK